jgi:TonB-dependent SusC/RagA subfamily outer membrane receptor
MYRCKERWPLRAGTLHKSIAQAALIAMIGGTSWASPTLETGIKTGIAHRNFTRADRQIKGRVTDGDTPDGIPGVNVVIKGSQTGSVTDATGNYSLEVPEGGAILVFSYVGYVSQEVETGTRSMIDVALKADSKSLNEVVVVGYGTQKKVNLTGAVDQVGQEVLQNRPLPNLAQGLVGVVPNLNIRMFDGKPTQSPAFNIRGTTSIGQNGSALVLIDGVEGDPRMLNPQDIESISVLKDAASASIYGARAVFGVVLITTKPAPEGKIRVSYSANYSIKIANGSSRQYHRLVSVGTRFQRCVVALERQRQHADGH